MKSNGEKVALKEKARDPNRGFKLDVTGKLIIDEPKRGKSNQDDSDSDDDMDSANGDDAKKPNDDDDDDDEDEATENAKMKARKRKASSAMSQASGKTGTESRYVSGGKGIHRNLNGASSAASTRTGYSFASGKTGASAKTTKSTAYGSEYKSNKSKGDIKKKGTALDPYAYIPLSRNSLNKRKRAKSAGQFKSIVNGARKGAAAGSKRRKV